MIEYLMGVLTGSLCALLVLGLIPNSRINLYNEVIKECEKNLPRNQYCKVIGVPVQGETK